VPSPPGAGTAQFTPPAEPPGLFKSHEELTAEAAQAAGATTGAQINAQIDARNKAYQDARSKLIAQGIPEESADREATVQAALATGHPLPYSMMKPQVVGVKVFDPSDPNRVVQATRIFNPYDQSIEFRD